MILKEHIGIWENVLDKEICEHTIKQFDYFTNETNLKEYSQFTRNGETQFQNEGVQGRKDKQLFLERIDSNIHNEIQKKVSECFEEYIKSYPSLLSDGCILSNFYTKIQKTENGGGFHVWHCENGYFYFSNRVCAWSIYLNDIPAENGGATEFLHQKLSFQPKQGTVLIFPAGYTHTHRGGFLTGDIPKYIATGWFEKQAPMRTQEQLIEEIKD